VTGKFKWKQKGRDLPDQHRGKKSIKGTVLGSQGSEKKFTGGKSRPKCKGRYPDLSYVLRNQKEATLRDNYVPRGSFKRWGEKRLRAIH